jgi:hypothetical protein
MAQWFNISVQQWNFQLKNKGISNNEHGVLFSFQVIIKKLLKRNFFIDQPAAVCK